MKPIVRVKNVSKFYRLGELRRPKRIVDWFGEKFSKTSDTASRNGKEDLPDEIWALRDVSFDVEPGEVVGIIGRNGAGKSTLLKILSRITEPSEGEVELFGRVSSLLEVGTGFHPELTGRDNVYLNGSILGLKRAEIQAKFDEIVAFAGVEKFLDTPVKRYSSGMQMRLAFAVAAHLEPEILIVDEVLAVGDAEFQRKCIGKMGEVAKSGRTILFVSHNMAAVENLCSRGIVLESGTVVRDADVDTAIHRYMASGHALVSDISFSVAKADEVAETFGLTRLQIADGSGRPATSFPVGGAVTFTLTYRLPQDQRDIRCFIDIHSERGEKIAVLGNYMQDGRTFDASGECAFVCSIPSLPLVPGSYFVSVGCRSASFRQRLELLCRFEILAADIFGTGRLPEAGWGLLALPAHWAMHDSNVLAS